MDNPFLTVGYAGADYFCDRVSETEKLTNLLTNGNNVALISPRRMGKTGLIYHCFQQKKISNKFNTFVVDIYATKNLNEFVYEMGRQIVNTLKPKGKKAIEKFLGIVKSLKNGVTFDIQGIPTWSLQFGDIQTPQITLDEIFSYIENADKPSLVAIDEFQSEALYPEKNVEATLRTYIQRCNKARFIFSGSQRSMMSEMFASAARPFYQSVSIFNLNTIPEEKYREFIQGHFKNAGKQILDETIHEAYKKFDGVTWYIQKIMNQLFFRAEKKHAVNVLNLEESVETIVSENADAYGNLFYLISPSQKSLLLAISQEGKASGITGKNFIKRYSLASASSVQKAILSLQEKQLITNDLGTYEVYDKFMALWLKKQVM